MLKEARPVYKVWLDGNVVAATQTINNLFGSKVTVPGTGRLLNNTMNLFDPHPGGTLSIAPGKRNTSSMAPTIVLDDWSRLIDGGVNTNTGRTGRVASNVPPLACVFVTVIVP